MNHLLPDFDKYDAITRMLLEAAWESRIPWEIEEGYLQGTGVTLTPEKKEAVRLATLAAVEHANRWAAVYRDVCDTDGLSQSRIRLDESTGALVQDERYGAVDIDCEEYLFLHPTFVPSKM